MLYVALSRAKTLEGLRVERFSSNYVRANQKAIKYYEELEKLHQDSFTDTILGKKEIFRDSDSVFYVDNKEEAKYLSNDEINATLKEISHALG